MHNFGLSPLYRSAIGFDCLFSHSENNQNQSNGGHPPCNTELVGEDHYHIAVTAASLVGSELKVTTQDSLLMARGVCADEQKERAYLCQGIAKRNFERKFQLTENTHVHDANLINGLLYIGLERVIPEAKKLRRVETN